MAINFPSSPQLNDEFTSGDTTWRFDGIAWVVISNIQDTALPTFLNLTDTPGTFTADAVVKVNAAGDALEFTDQPMGDVNQNAFSSIVVQNEGSAVADQVQDELILVAGTNINITVDEASDTLTFNVPDPTINVNWSSIGDVPSGVTVDSLYDSAMIRFIVDNDAATSYLFQPHYSTANPTLYVLNGTTVAFDLNAVPGHPFQIQDSTGTNISAGLVHVDTDGTVSTGSNAQGKDSGTLYWRISTDIGSPPNYRYQCAAHANMVGPITIKDISAI
jgi:plastocyanin